MNPAHPYYVIGGWFYRHYRDMAKERGIKYTRVRMRKASIPEHIRAAILSPEGFPPLPEKPERRSLLVQFLHALKGIP